MVVVALIEGLAEALGGVDDLVVEVVVQVFTDFYDRLWKFLRKHALLNRQPAAALPSRAGQCAGTVGPHPAR
jgi:hypothetical protein